MSEWSHSRSCMVALYRQCCHRSGQFQKSTFSFVLNDPPWTSHTLGSFSGEFLRTGYELSFVAYNWRVKQWWRLSLRVYCTAQTDPRMSARPKCCEQTTTAVPMWKAKFPGIPHRTLPIILWNADGLTSHRNQIQVLLNDKHIDIALITETHFTQRTNFNIPGYTLYRTDFLGNAARGGAAILIHECLSHHSLPPH